METIIKEYGSLILAAAGAFVMIAIFGKVFANSDGLLAHLIQVWGNGGF